MLETGAAKTNSAESPRGPASDSSRPPAKVGGPRSYRWKDMPNKYSLSLLVSLNAPANGQAAVGARGTLERLFFSMSQRHYRLSPSSGDPSLWGFFCPYSSLFQESGQ